MRILFSFLLIFSFLFSIVPLQRPVLAQDLVSTEDVAGGSSVFVFRGSRKAPQSRAAGGRVVSSRSAGGSINRAAQIAAAEKKRRAAAIIARKKASVAAANKKIALSNTLTAKAEGFLDTDKTDLAIENYRSALVQNSKNTRASEGLSNALTAKGIDVAGETNNEAAVPVFEEAVKFDKQNDVAYAKLGAIHDAHNRNDQAIANYEKALAINPEYSMLYPSLGIAYMDKGDIAKAENSLQKADAAQMDTVETRFLRGLLMFKQNKNSEALAAFDKTLEMDPKYATAQYYRGQVLDRMDRKDDAIGAYQKTLEVEPSNTGASFDLGVAYYNKGDYSNATSAYLQTIKYDNKNAQAHANLASTYRQLERYPDANAEYKVASETIKTPDLYSEWGFCLGKTNDWEKAVDRLKTANTLDPSAVDNTNVGWGYYNAGFTETTAKNDTAAKENYEQSKIFLQKAVEQDPKLDAAYMNLGSTHNALGEYQEAVSVLNTAVSLHPKWAIALNQLGVGFRGLKDFTNAVAIFKQVLSLDSGSVRGLFNLGETYFASGNKKEAKKVYDQLKKIDPNVAVNLDNVLSGKINDATQQLQNKVPKVPKIPKFPH